CTLLIIPSVMATSGLLAVAGLLGINLKGLGLLKVSFAANLLVDLGAAVFQALIQIKSLGITKWYLGEMTAASGSGAGGPALEMTMQFGLYASLFFGVFWLVMKLVFYVVGLVYF